MAASNRVVLGVDLSSRAVVPHSLKLQAGRAAGWMRLPTKDAQSLLREVARLVADLPRDGSREVVWVSGANELLVRTDGATLSLSSALVTVGIPVSCDQVDGEVTIKVPFAVGTEKELRGLFMSTVSTPGGPDVVVSTWAESLLAFAWECLLELARHLAAQAGKDARGRPLVPAAVGAGRGVLLVKPMARNEA